MKVVLSRRVWCALALVAPVWAVQAASPAGDAVREQKQVEQAISREQAQIKQLQGDVAREESRSHQADTKLKQQDQQIADLQHELDALKAAPKGMGQP